MGEIIISPSLLGYESNLRAYNSSIREILDTGIGQLHIDVMRQPFIPGRNAFSEEAMHRLYLKFGDKVDFDFHLMVPDPRPLIDTIDSFVPNNKRSNITITVHRESYRIPEQIGDYAQKEYDLLTVDSGDSELNQRLRIANNLAGELLYGTLIGIKGRGYKTGLALEPGTSLENLASGMTSFIDMILLMSVCSGAGGQSYHPEVTSKIEELHKAYPDLMIQVDGGVNEETLATVVNAGANNLVIGSYITSAEDITQRIEEIKRKISEQTSHHPSS